MDRDPEIGACRPKLLSVPAFLFLVGLIAAALFVVFPGRDGYIARALKDAPDRLTARYLELSLEAAPDDEESRISLVRVFINLEDFPAARSVLEVVWPAGSGAIQTRYLYLQILRGEMRDTSDPRLREMIGAEIQALLGTLVLTGLGATELETVAETSLEFGLTDLAKRTYQRLADVDGENRLRYLDAAARWSVASGDPLEASEIAAHAALWEPKLEDSRKRVLEAARLQEAAERGDLAFQTLRELLLRYPTDAELLEHGLRLARSQQDLDSAVIYGRRIRATRPGDVDVLTRQIELELEAGNLIEAEPLARARCVLEPDDHGLRVEFARVLEWNSKPRAALKEWLVVARNSRDESAIEAALRLSSGLFRDDLIVEMLLLREQREPLDLDATDRLVVAYERIARPEDAIGFLRARLQKEPEEIALWRRLVRLEVSHWRDREAVATWGEIEQRFGLTLDDAMALARLLWRGGDSLGALELLERYSESADASDIEFWTLAGNLAWDEESDETARLAERYLWNQERTPETAVRLYELAMGRGDSRQAASFAEYLWTEQRLSGYLIAALEMAVVDRHWEHLGFLLESGADEKQVTDNFRYWILRGEYEKHRENNASALAAFEHALTLNPVMTEIRANILWYLVDARRSVELEHKLAEWRGSAESDPTLWSVYAAGLATVGRHEEAVHWHRRIAEARADDFLAVLSYADALERVGRDNSAWRLRRHVVLEHMPRAAIALRDAASTDSGHSVGQYVYRLREELGPARGEHWFDALQLTTFKTPFFPEYAISWYLADGRIDGARRWLLAEHSRRLEHPAWQRVALALAENDLTRLEQLVNEEPEALNVADRIEAYRRLSRGGEGLLLSLERLPVEGGASDVLLRQALQLYSDQPNAFRVGAAYRELGDLNISMSDLGAARTRGDTGFEFNAAERVLDAPSTDLDLDGHDLESDISIGVFARHASRRSALHLGVNEQEESTLPYARLSHERQLWRRVRGRFDASWNALTEASPGLRAAGAEDTVEGTLEVQLTQREFAIFRAGWQRYHGREGGSLAQGVEGEISAGHQLSLGDRLCRFRVFGLFSANDLQAALPREFADVLPAGAEVETVLPDEFGIVGAAVSLQHGTPGLWAPDASNPRYVLDVAAGWLYPAGDIAYNVTFGIAFTLLGRDELSLSGFYADSQGGIESQVYQGINLRYVHRFGG